MMCNMRFFEGVLFNWLLDLRFVSKSKSKYIGRCRQDKFGLYLCSAILISHIKSNDLNLSPYLILSLLSWTNETIACMSPIIVTRFSSLPYLMETKRKNKVVYLNEITSVVMNEIALQFLMYLFHQALQVDWKRVLTHPLVICSMHAFYLV